MAGRREKLSVEVDLDDNGIALTLERTGDAEARRSVHVHLHYGLFADILSDLARGIAAMPEDSVHRRALRDAAHALHTALADDGAAGGLSSDEDEMALRLIE